jgi:transposase
MPKKISSLKVARLTAAPKIPLDSLRARIKTYPHESFTQIAKHFNVSSTTVREYIRRYKIDYKKKQLLYDKEHLQRYIQEHDRVTKQQIADDFGKSYEAVRGAMSYHKVKAPQRWIIQSKPSVYKKQNRRRLVDLGKQIAHFLKENPDTSIKSMSHHFDVSATTISNYLHRHGLKHLIRLPPKDDWIAIKKYIAKHPQATYREIGLAFNKKTGTIRATLHRHHILLASLQKKVHLYDEQTLRRYLAEHPRASRRMIREALGGGRHQLEKAMQTYGLITRFSKSLAYAMPKNQLQKYLSEHPKVTLEEAAAFFQMMPRRLKKILTLNQLPCPPSYNLKKEILNYLQTSPNATYHEIAHALGKNPQIMSGAFKRYGITYRGTVEPTYRKEDINTFLKEHPQSTYEDLQKEFNIPLSKLYHWAKKYKIKVIKKVKCRHTDQEIKDYMNKNPDASYADLSQVFKYKQSSMAARLKKLNIPYPKNLSIKYDRDTLEIYLLDYPQIDYHDLARLFKGTRSGVYNALRRYGLIDFTPRISVRYPKDALEKWMKDHPDATYAQLAKAFKTKPRNIYPVLKRYDLPRPKRSLNKLSKEKLTIYITTYPDANSAQIAKDFQCNLPYLKRSLKKYGLSSKPDPVRVHPRKYKPEAIARYLKKHPHATFKDISKDFNTNKNFYAVLKRNGIPALKNPLIKYTKENLEKYLTENKNATLSDIAKAFNGSKGGAWCALKRYNLPTSSRFRNDLKIVQNIEESELTDFRTNS